MFGVWKKFLSLGEVINFKYKRYIIENYRPDWEQVKETAFGINISKEEYESMK